MKSNRTTALLMLLVFLLVVAVVIIFLTGLDRPARSGNPFETVTVSAEPSIVPETPAPTPSAEPSVAPTSSVPVYFPPSTAAPVSTAAPASTAAPVSTASPAQAAPAASASPTPIPGADSNMLPAQELIPVVPGANSTGTETSPANLIPSGTSIGSGTFRSDSGSSINIHADWNAVVSGAGTVDITVTAFVDSYSLYTTASPEALNIAVDGQYVSLASPAIEIQDSTVPVSTLINNRSFTISLTGGETRNIPIEVIWNYRGTYGGTYLDTIECGGNITLSR